MLLLTYSLATWLFMGFHMCLNQLSGFPLLFQTHVVCTRMYIRGFSTFHLFSIAFIVFPQFLLGFASTSEENPHLVKTYEVLIPRKECISWSSERSWHCSRLSVKASSRIAKANTRRLLEQFGKNGAARTVRSQFEVSSKLVRSEFELSSS